MFSLLYERNAVCFTHHILPDYSLCLYGSIGLLVFQFGQIFNASHISKHPGISPQNSLQGLKFTSKGLTSGFIVESTFQ